MLMKSRTLSCSSHKSFQMSKNSRRLSCSSHKLPNVEKFQVAVAVPQDYISKFETENPTLNEKLFEVINKVLVEKFKGVSFSFTKNE